MFLKHDNSHACFDKGHMRHTPMTGYLGALKSTLIVPRGSPSTLNAQSQIKPSKFLVKLWKFKYIVWFWCFTLLSSGLCDSIIKSELYLQLGDVWFTLICFDLNLSFEFSSFK